MAAAAERPLCFVLMPFGVKPDSFGGAAIDFDRIYREAIAPAVDGAEMQPIRADEERVGGIIHKPMFERLLLCDFAVADLTTANPNVFYELGVRHAVRPRTTVAIFAAQQRVPFDVAPLRALPYELGKDHRFGRREAAALRGALADRLRELREQARAGDPIDSPLFQLLGASWNPQVAHLKTDVFQQEVAYSEAAKRELAQIRAASRSPNKAAERLAAFVGKLPPLDSVEAGVLVDTLLTYRDLEDWSGLLELVDRFPATLRRQVLVREQRAFALNRRAEREGRPEDREEALAELVAVEREHGPSSETSGLIGRAYKASFLEARRAGRSLVARAHLDDAITAYRRGFEADPRDAYPGVNLVTLLDVRGQPSDLEERDRLVPVVRFAAERAIGATPTYWDHATLLELAVLADDQAAAEGHAGRALATSPARWQVGSTADNLHLIADSRAARAVEVGWVSALADQLTAD